MMKFIKPTSNNRPLLRLPTPELATQSALQDLARAVTELARVTRSRASDGLKESAGPINQGALADAFRQAGGTGAV